MAKYKYGQNELDLQNLITNLDNNVDSYIQSKTDWSQAQKESFKEGYRDYIAGLQDQLANDTGRFSADAFGTITDKEGKLKDNTDTDYIYNKKGQLLNPETTSKRKLKKGTPFYRNQELAIFNKIIAKGMIDKMNEQSKDVPSLADYWQQQYNPQGDLADYSAVAALDKEGEYTNRIAEIKGLYDSYKQKYKISPEQIAKYDALINSLSTDNIGSDKWKNQIIRDSAAAGIGKFLTGYLGFNTPKPEKAFDINNDEDVIKRYQLEEKIKLHPELRDTYIANARADYNRETQAELNAFKTNQKQLAQEAYNKKLSEFWKANPALYNVHKRQTKDNFSIGVVTGNKELTDRFSSTTGEGKGWNDNINQTFKRANKTGDYFYTPLTQPITLTTGHKITNLGQLYSYLFPYLKQNNLLTSFDEKQDKAGNTVYRLKNSKNKNGEWLYMFYYNGKLHTYRSKSYQDLLPKAQEGLKFETARSLRNKQQTAITKARAKATGKTYQQQKAADTVNQELTGTDIARLTGVGLDIGSMIAAYAPGYGTAISAVAGLGSTAANLGADLSDGTMSTWDAIKNAGINVGFDVLGLFGGVGKGGKIAKTLVRYTPRILAAIGTIQGVKNAPEIMASFKRLTNDGYSALTVQDWQNISQGIGLVTGIGGAAGRKLRNYKKTTEHTWDQVGLYMNKKGTKNKTMFTFKGEDAKAIRNAKNSAEIKAITDKYAKLRNYELSPSTRITRPHLRKIGRNKETGEFNFNPLSMKSDKVQLYDIYQDKNGNVYANKEGIRGWLQPYGASKNHSWNHEVNNYIPKSQQLNISKVRKKAQLKSIDSEIRAAENERAANQTLYDEYKVALDMRKQAMEDNKADDIQTANNLLREAISNIRGKQTAYNKLRETLKNNQNLVYTDTSNKQVQASWKDILSKYKVGYKQGGVIKAQTGVKTPWYNALKAVNKDTDFTSNWDTSTLYAGDTSNGLKNPWASNQVGNVIGRYSPTEGYTRKQAEDIELKDQLYKDFENSLFNDDGTFNKIGEAWAREVDKLIPQNSTASFYDPKTGKLRTKWVTTNNDIYGRPSKTYTNLRDYVRSVRNDNIIGARHNIFVKKGKRYYYTDANGNKVYVNPQDLSKYKYSDKSINSFNNGVLWSDYELTGLTPEAGITNAKIPDSIKTKINQSPEDLLNNISPTRTYGLVRAILADKNNREMLEASYTQPYLIDPMEIHRNIYSDLGAEMQGQKDAAALQRLATTQAGTDFDRNAAMALDAKLKGIELKDLKFKASNDLERQTAEASWAQEKENKQNRWQTANSNKQAIYENDMANLQRKLATKSQNFQIWDTYRQQLQQEAATDWQANRARMDAMVENDITNAIKNNISGYVPNLSPQDVQLWNDIQTGRKTTANMTVAEQVRFRVISEQANQAKYDELRRYYKMPKNQYRQNIQTTSDSSIIAKDGGKLQIARLRAAIADADRFYKTTKDFADRTERTIARLTNKKKKKKQ